MQSLRELISRVRAWRFWYALRRTPAPERVLLVYASRPILREVSRSGVRVYSLCGSCGAQLAASATLCDACARSRSTPNAQVDLSDALLRLFGVVSHWSLRARGFGVLLCLPILIATLADRRVRGKR